MITSLPFPNEIPVDTIAQRVPTLGIDTNKFTGFTSTNTTGIVSRGESIVQDLQGTVNAIPTPKERQLQGGGGSRPGEVELSVTENTPAAQFLDNQLWKISVSITNYSPPVKPVFIPGNYIHELVLEHDIIDPCYWRGSMIVTSNRFGILEGENPEDNLNLEMLFRGDGRDEMLIELVPLFADSVELPPETWEIKSDFIVYDVEDIPWKDGGGMAKKIYFWHKAYALLTERGAPFSTAKHANVSNKSIATNEERMLPVGEAIKYLLEDCNLKQYIDYDEWDIGATESRIFYNSSPGSTSLDSLHDILPYYVSSDGGPGLLYFNRGRNKFQLLGLRKFFDNAGKSTPGKYYYETFMLGTGDSGTLDTNITPNKTPTINASRYDYANMLKKYNIIRDNSYIVTETSGADSMESFVSQMVHTYNHKDKIFNTIYKESEIQNHKKLFKKNYTDKLLPGAGGQPLMVLNSAKKNQSRVSQRFISSIDKQFNIIEKVGGNYLTLSTIFLNMGINFKVQGSTHRHAGRFVGIEKNKNSDNKYDHRMLGQWFVTSVITRWRDNQLYNELVANKVSSFSNLRFNEEV